MSDAASIVLVIVALFALESFAIVPDGAVVFVSGWLGRYAARVTGTLMQVAKGRLLILHPLFASSHHTIAGLPALALDAEGITDCGPEDADARKRRPFVPWEKLGRVTRDGSRIRAEGLSALECGGPRAARLWARALNEMRSASPARRTELARRWMRLRFSTAIVRRREERINAACASLELFTDVAWYFLVACCIALLWRGGLRVMLIVFVAGEISGWVAAFLFWRAHARLHPRAGGERVGKAIVMALCFPVALRARAVLARDALAFAHPAAVAATLLPRKRGVEFARRLALRWTHPLPVGDARPDGDVRPGGASSTLLMIDAMKTVARELDVKWSSLIAPPSVSDAALQSYCPRCHAAYVLVAGTCADCPGVALVPLAVRGRKRETNA